MNPVEIPTLVFHFLSLYDVQQRFSNSVPTHTDMSRSVARCVAINMTIHNAIQQLNTKSMIALWMAEEPSRLALPVLKNCINYTGPMPPNEQIRSY
jgi:hypothetical protein